MQLILEFFRTECVSYQKLALFGESFVFFKFKTFQIFITNFFQILHRMALIYQFFPKKNV